VSEKAVGYFVIPPPPTWRERLLNRLWPEPAIANPRMEHKDVFVCRTQCSFSWADRLRILLTGRLMVETRTVTENEIGQHLTNSIAYPTR
jgi:hypothetical protein